MAIFNFFFFFCIWLHVTIKIRRYKLLWKISKSVLTNLSSQMSLWADPVQRTLIIKQHGTWTTWHVEYFSSVRCSGSEYWCSLTEIKGVGIYLYHWRMFSTICLKYLVLLCLCIISHYFCSQGFWKTLFQYQRDKNTPDTCRFHLEKHQKIYRLSWNLLLILSTRCQFGIVL